MVISFLLTTLLAASPSMACKRLPDYGLLLKTDYIISSVSLDREGSTCTCCGLCHSHPGCKSFDFDAINKLCILYDRVGGYADITAKKRPRDRHSFFLMESSSQSNEFCIDDTDCVRPGEFCSAHICTQDDTVTCKDIKRLAPSLASSEFWISIGRHRLPTTCRMTGVAAGFTTVFQSRAGRWNADQLRSRVNPRSLSGQGTYSILGRANEIRDSHNGTHYQVIVNIWQNFTGLNGPKHYKSQEIIYNVTADFELLGERPRDAAWTSTQASVPFRLEGGVGGTGQPDQRIVFPYLVSTGSLQYTINRNAPQEAGVGAIARYDTASAIKWTQLVPRPHKIKVYIRE